MNRFYRTAVDFDGECSMPGTQALIDLVESSRDQLGHAVLISALVDMRKLYDAPAGSPFVLGKWLLALKEQMDRIAVFSGKPFAMGIAPAVVTVAAMVSNSPFGNHLNEAVRFLC